jgi:hypothetical protein
MEARGTEPELELNPEPEQPCQLSPLFAAHQRLAFATYYVTAASSSPLDSLDVDVVWMVGAAPPSSGADMSGTWHLRDTRDETACSVDLDRLWLRCAPQFGYEFTQATDKPSTFVGLQIPLKKVLFERNQPYPKGVQCRYDNQIPDAFSVEGSVMAEGASTVVRWRVFPTPGHVYSFNTLAGEQSGTILPQVFCKATLTRNSAGNLCLRDGIYGNEMGKADLGEFAGERVGENAAGAEPPEPEVASESSSSFVSESSGTEAAHNLEELLNLSEPEPQPEPQLEPELEPELEPPDLLGGAAIGI